MAELLRHRQNERGGNRYVQPTVTAPHLDSTDTVEKVVSKAAWYPLGGLITAFNLAPAL